MDDQTLAIAVLWYVGFLFSLVFHEGAHAWVANWWGDNTGKEEGLLTLNPIPHIQREPIGALVLPLALLLSSGGRMFIGYGSCPLDPLQMRNPKWGMITTAAAGPLANIILMVLSFCILLIFEHTGVKGEHIAYRFFMIFLILNTFLVILNMIPIPPLDGSVIVKHLLPLELAIKYVQLQKYSLLFFILLFFTGAANYIFGIPMLIVTLPFGANRDYAWPE